MQTKQSWLERIKKRNKLGFSLVELIVIIAMMAVLTAVLAPALLSYTESSRAQKDVSAMDEATNAVFLSLADMSVYDELVANSLPENVSCYIDTNDENDHLAHKEVTKQAIGSTLEKYIFNDNARQQDEVKYYAAGNMRGVTITFSPNPSSNEASYILADGVVNGFLTDGTTKLVDLPLVYNAMRQIMGDVIKLTSQTYRNSDYTIFIKIGSTGGSQANAQDAIEAYGQYSGTNLSLDDVKYYVAYNRKVGDPEAGTEPESPEVEGDKAPVMIEGAGQVFDKAAPETLTFRSSAPFSEFQNVMVNGSIVDPQYYTVGEGSTVVTLLVSYLNSLNVNTYTITIVSDGGTPSVTFSVVNNCTHTNTELINAQNANCTNGGYSGDEVCSDCGFVVANGANTDANGDHVFDKATDMTCKLCDTKFKPYTFKPSDYDTLTESNTATLAHVIIPQTFYANTGVWYKTTKIDKNAFQNRSDLISVVIPNGVTLIDTAAFSGCKNLSSLVFPNGITEIGSYSFQNCTGLTGNLIIPESVTKIGGYAFSGCSGFTGNLIIPDSVTTLGYHAFENCTGFDGTLTLSAQLTKIESYVFKSCSNLKGELVIPNTVTSIGDYAFFKCSGFTSLTLQDGITTIGNYAFDNCTGFAGDLVIPDGVKTIGQYAFRKCTGFIGALDLSNTLEVISSHAFDGCKFTGVLTLPQTLTTIGAYAFTSCSEFEGVLVIPDSVTKIGSDAFKDCGKLTKIEFGANVTTIGEYAFRGCIGLVGELTISDSVTTLGKYAFYGCANITNVVIPSGITEIKDGVFGACSNLHTIVIEGEITAIGASAFSECVSLKQFEMPNSVVGVGIRAFYKCTGLQQITLSESLQTIEKEAFYDCAALTSIVIPESVTTIDDYALLGCDGLESITINGANFTVGSVVFPIRADWKSATTGQVYEYDTIPTDRADTYIAVKSN